MVIWMIPVTALIYNGMARLISMDTVSYTHLFKLVDVLTAAENIVLGLPGKGKLDMKRITEDIQKLADKYGFELDLSQNPRATVEHLYDLNCLLLGNGHFVDLL